MPCCSATSTEVQPKTTTSEEKPQQSSCLFKAAAITLLAISAIAITVGVLGSLGLHGNPSFSAVASLGKDAINALIGGGCFLFAVSATMITKLACDAQKSGKGDATKIGDQTEVSSLVDVPLHEKLKNKAALEKHLAQYNDHAQKKDIFKLADACAPKLNEDSDKIYWVRGDLTLAFTKEEGFKVITGNADLANMSQNYLLKGVIQSGTTLVYIYEGKIDVDSTFADEATATKAIPEGKEMELKDWEWPATETQKANVERVRTTERRDFDLEKEYLLFEHANVFHALYHDGKELKIETFPAECLVTIENKIAAPNKPMTTWVLNKTAVDRIAELTTRAAVNLRDDHTVHVRLDREDPVTHVFKRGEHKVYEKNDKDMPPHNGIADMSWATYDSVNDDCKLMMTREIGYADTGLTNMQAYIVEFGGVSHLIYKKDDKVVNLTFEYKKDAETKATELNVTLLRGADINFRALPSGEGDIEDTLSSRAQQHLNTKTVLVFSKGDDAEDPFGKRYYVVQKEETEGPFHRESFAKEYIEENGLTEICEGDSTWMTWDQGSETETLGATLAIYHENAEYMSDNHYTVIKEGAGWHLLSEEGWTVHATEQDAKAAIPSGAIPRDDTAFLTWNAKGWKNEEMVTRILKRSSGQLVQGQAFIYQLDDTHHALVQNLKGNLDVQFARSEAKATEMAEGLTIATDLGFLQGVELSTPIQVMRRAVKSLPNDFEGPIRVRHDSKSFEFEKQSDGLWSDKKLNQNASFGFRTFSEEELNIFKTALEAQEDIGDLQNAILLLPSQRSFVCFGGKVHICGNYIQSLDELSKLQREAIIKAEKAKLDFETSSSHLVEVALPYSGNDRQR